MSTEQFETDDLAGEFDPVTMAEFRAAYKVLELARRSYENMDLDRNATRVSVAHDEIQSFEAMMHDLQDQEEIVGNVERSSWETGKMGPDTGDGSG